MGMDRVLAFLRYVQMHYMAYTIKVCGQLTIILICADSKTMGI